MIGDTNLVTELERLGEEALARVASVTDPSELESVRVEYLGRKEGRISAVLRKLGQLSGERAPCGRGRGQQG